MPVSSWSEVEWFIYEAPGRAPRVSSVELGPKSLRPGETRAATVRGVSRKTVAALLKAGTRPGDLNRTISGFVEAQHARSAGDRGPNLYRELVERRKAEAAALKDKTAA